MIKGYTCFKNHLGLLIFILFLNHVGLNNVLWQNNMFCLTALHIASLLNRITSLASLGRVVMPTCFALALLLVN